MSSQLDVLSQIRFGNDGEGEGSDQEIECFFVENGLSDFKSTLAIKRSYDQMILSFISRPQLTKDYKILKQLLNFVPKMFAQMSNPLFLSDLLTSCLDFDQMLDVQILSLKAIFILLQKHGLDYPNYYVKLYGMLMP
jgi:hypothetical protein